MTSSLSFHCVICFEEFDSHTIYPVVLPCGHTYVCCLCARRITKCMECRTSLLSETAVPVVEDSPTSDVYSRSGESTFSFSAARSGRTHSRSRSHASAMSVGKAPPATKARERIPLPKNLVLISLIESSSLVQKSTNNRLVRQLSCDDLDIFDADDTNQEETRIEISSNIANAVSGTYAVAKKDGLKIVPRKKRHRSFFSTNTLTWQKQDAWKNNVEDIVNSEGPESPSKIVDESPELNLNYGDRIQVVSIVDNWAKLARGYGYVHFERSSDLVKVGNLLDKAAKFEAMINGLSNCRGKLLEAISTTERDAINLMSKLHVSLTEEEDMTVIGAEAFESDDDEPSEEREDLSASFSLNEIGVMSDDIDEYEPIKPEKPMSPDQTQEDTSGSMSYLDFFLCNITSYISGSSLGLNEFSIGGSGGQEDERRDDYQRSPNNSQMNMEGRRSQSELARAAQNWRLRNGKESYQFRTGRSGHHGVLSYTAHGHDQQPNSATLPRVSDHCGLTPKPRVRKHSTDSFFSDL